MCRIRHHQVLHADAVRGEIGSLRWVQILFLVGGAQMIVAEVVVAALLGHYFTASANWVVPTDVGLAVLIIICVFVSGFAYRYEPFLASRPHVR